ncbi:MAG: stage II sporulation protein D [Eubacteriales bacterium]|nr:stage II sporulation protein D [Eubacteriales bacterium]
MKRGYPPLWLCALLLVLALVWKMMGAPLSSEEFGNLRTPFWQARVLLPSRLQRVLQLWLPGQFNGQEGQTLNEDGTDPDQRELAKLKTTETVMLPVWLPQEGKIVSMSLESYVCGVVAAEMPAAYHAEALKAQAVAARTRALRQVSDSGCLNHSGAAVCGDSACCQGYASMEDCREKWGAEYELYRDRIVSAVQATRDELLTYEGEPITVLYHAMSGGKTENAQAVFASGEPYLVSVDSGGEENAKGYLTDSTFSFEEAAGLLSQAFPEKTITAQQVRRALTVGEYTNTGRVKTVLLDDYELDAQTVRKALKLRSTWFSITADQNGVTFHQRGYGHGVGMSQVGANSMAANGADYQTILAHYYPGTTLEKQ